MPVWHEATKKLQDDGKLQMLGIVQEQHPDRCRLFMQWKQMNWPVMVDSYNLLGVSVVPITLAIDEHGIIRHTKPRPEAEWLTRQFLDKSYQKPEPTNEETPPRPDVDKLRRIVKKQVMHILGAPRESFLKLADALVTTSPEGEMLDELIWAYRRAWSEGGADHFRLGVAFRKRYDSPRRKPGDFEQAVHHWAKALELAPNIYIWRRRIQQYGPRLDKPYPFYDWVVQARREINNRGDAPVKLAVEPSGAELAPPTKDFETIKTKPTDEREVHRITSAGGDHLHIETVCVPPMVSSGQSARVHVHLSPRTHTKAHWNNEAGPSILWLQTSGGWQVDRELHQLAPGPTAVSQEDRIIEFDVRCPLDAKPGRAGVRAHLLYYVCEGADGECLYRRESWPIKIDVIETSRE